MRHSASLIILFLLGSFALAGCSAEQQTPLSIKQNKHAIINGKTDTSDAHKAVVSLYVNYWSTKYSACTGTLIHPQWVLTAAHCVTDMDDYGNVSDSEYNAYYKIAVGNTDSQLRSNSYDISNIYYNKSYSSPAIDYNYSTTTADIALIKLKKAIPESVAKPILPHPKWLAINRAQVKKGINMEFVGFGYDQKGNSGTKLAFTGPINDYCGSADNDPAKGCKKGSYYIDGCHPSKDQCNNPEFYDYCRSGYLCVQYTDYVWLPHGSLFYLQDDGGPCQGDSGGPAFVKLGNVEYVSAITSYGDATCSKTGISTAVQDYYDWILSIAPEVATQYKEICGNGVDDDGNGYTDCDDAACVSASGCAAAQEICDNSKDDNGNGLVDCNDPDCKTATICKPEICDNLIDDNGNGLIDCDDLACKYNTLCKQENCTNGEDDNGNNLIDCDDPQCASTQSCNTINPGIDIEHPGIPINPGSNDKPEENGSSTTAEICNNNIDDDNNGLIDCKDPACINNAVCSEVEFCNNKVDDNNDGLVDCYDPLCALDSDCQNTGIIYETCDNKVDDNHDGYVDCGDPQCRLSASCTTNNASKEICNNFKDDNGNGKVDCEDPDCARILECMLTNHFLNGSSGCQSHPTSSQPPFSAALLLLMASLAIAIRRMKKSI